MKNIIFLLCCIFYMSALGQSHFVEDTPEVRNWLDNMFQHLDKSKILMVFFVTMPLNWLIWIFIMARN